MKLNKKELIKLYYNELRKVYDIDRINDESLDIFDNFYTINLSFYEKQKDEITRFISVNHKEYGETSLFINIKK